MFETYRMLGAQREAELLAEAERLHLGRRHRRRRQPIRRLLTRFAPDRRSSKHVEVVAQPEVLP